MTRFLMTFSGVLPCYVSNNCGNANLLGVMPLRREVDHQQGSKSVCCNDGGSYSKSGDSDC